MSTDTRQSADDPLSGVSEQDRDAWLRQLFAGKMPEIPATKAATASDDEHPAAFELGLPPEPVMPSAAANIPKIHPMLGSYELVYALGKGGMGEVLLAKHVILNLQVAIKVLHPKLLNEHMLGRFRNETQTLARLAHPNVVRATDGGVIDEVHYLVMEYVRGVDLDQLAKHHAPPHSPLSIEHVCALAHDAALGLAHAHSRGLVHRDVKPSNIMLSCEGEVKVLDFGLILLQEKQDDLTASLQVLGTRNYMSPEQVANPHLVDWRTDIFSLGVTCFTLLTGMTPQPGQRLESLRNVPGELAELIHQMLETSRADRPQTCEEVAARLQPLAGNAHLKDLWDSYTKEAPTAVAQTISPELIAKLSGANLRPTKEQLKGKVQEWFKHYLSMIERPGN